MLRLCAVNCILCLPNLLLQYAVQMMIQISVE